VEPDLALLVLRGWLPAADGLRPDLALGWPDGMSEAPVTIEGVAIPPSDGRGGQPIEVDAGGETHLAIAGIDIALVDARLPYRVLPYPLRADGNAEPGLPLPPRRIAIDAGSHLSYAIQWFAFAAITLVGTTILLRKERTR
jgi:surfeit locus 1 family protein